MSDELKERPIDFETERPSQLEIDAAVAEITARLKAADAKEARIAELENLLKAVRDFVTDEHIARDIDTALLGVGDE